MRNPLRGALRTKAGASSGCGCKGAAHRLALSTPKVEGGLLAPCFPACWTTCVLLRRQAEQLVWSELGSARAWAGAVAHKTKVQTFLNGLEAGIARQEVDSALKVRETPDSLSNTHQLSVHPRHLGARGASCGLRAANRPSLFKERSSDFRLVTMAASSGTKRLRSEVQGVGGGQESISAAKQAHVAGPEAPLEDAQAVAAWLLYPLSPSVFMRQYYERRPVLLRRPANYFASLPPCLGQSGPLFSIDGFKALVDTGALTFEQDLDVTLYKDEKRLTLQGSGVPDPADVWSQRMQQEGCSLRLRCPQAHLPPVHALCASLEDFFSTFVGSNAYLTPSGSQGFAPHYDDIEAFILQLEGRKHWRVYPPRSEEETLPRLSSPNLEQGDIGQPALEATLGPGDLLYFPRGWVHQADTVGDSPSLHLTVSAGQKTTWADLLSGVLEGALQQATDKHLALRRLPPPAMLRVLGAGNAPADGETDADSPEVPIDRQWAQGGADAQIVLAAAGLDHGDAVVNADRLATALDVSNPADALPGLDVPPQASQAQLIVARASMHKALEELLSIVSGELSPAVADAAADAMGARFLKERLPPAGGLHPRESVPVVSFDSKLKWVSPTAARIELGEHDGEPVATVTCSARNSLRFLQRAPLKVVFPISFAPAVDALTEAHPQPVQVGKLPIVDEDDDVVEVSEAARLFKEGGSEDDVEEPFLELMQELCAMGAAVVV